MRPEDVPVLAVLRQSIGFNAERQRVLAENVANANTPGYTARDLDVDAFHDALRSEMQARRTGGGGINMQSGTREWSTIDSPDSQTTVNGNSVVLEEQMVRANQTRIEYETALSLYKKSLSLMRMAIKSPGR